jgi:hypothetical protein
MECEKCKQDFETSRGQSKEWVVFNRLTQNLTHNTQGSNLIRETRSGIMPVEIFLCDGCFNGEQKILVKRCGWIFAASFAALAIYFVIFFEAIKAVFLEGSGSPAIFIPLFVFFAVGGLALGLFFKLRGEMAILILTRKFLKRKLPQLQRKAFSTVEEHRQFVKQSRSF